MAPTACRRSTPRVTGRTLAVSGLSLALATCLTAAISAVPAAALYPTPTTPPVASNSVVGPMAPPNLAPSLSTITKVFTTMTYTRYSHTYTANTTTGVYKWDCVGLTDWVLAKSAPQAWTSMHTSLGIKRGYVPTPLKWATYLQGTLPTSWQRVPTVTAIAPGDYLIFGPNTATKFVGHAVIAAGPPMKLADGSYALAVYDSTGSPHGNLDSRWTDPRTGVPPAPGSGVGHGTMRLFVGPGGIPAKANWSVGKGGPTMVGVSVTVGRALR